MLWSDNFVIPNKAKHKKNAETLINYYYDPKVMAQVDDYVNYISAGKGTKEALDQIDPDVADNPLIFPVAEALARRTSSGPHRGRGDQVQPGSSSP